MLRFSLPDSSDTTAAPEVSPDTVPTTSSFTAPLWTLREDIHFVFTS